MKHHEMSPSSFPALEKCACFKSGPSGKSASAGTMQHKYLQELLEMKIPSTELKDDEIDSIDYAYGEINQMVSDKGGAIEDIKTELEVSICDSGLNEISFGHIDAAYDDIIFDYKSGQDHRYEAQMIGYALGYMQEHGLESVTVVELYGRMERKREYIVTLSEAIARIEAIHKRFSNSDKIQEMNKYCGWCKHQVTCPAVIEPVGELSKAMVPQDSPAEQLQKLVGMDMKEISPKDFSFLIPTAKVISDWCDAIKARAKVLLIQGENIPGYRLWTKKGRRSIVDLGKALEIMGIDKTAFLDVCTVSMSKLIPLWMEHTEMPKGKAKVDLEKKLADIYKRGKESHQIAET